ncbi:hypothetical protein F503_06246 [Ophiostoma piceae UAMH 11346]|uniref:Uncharacterized protein n=1 Tax=Ophiostoma piceae (strain UAMH 11346) TaxID=1262450 RepID=S3BW01_OPHP1|nr:hypothetical protein F503_06246 [Ophiostoma piceae UAMH 11346]
MQLQTQPIGNGQSGPVHDFLATTVYPEGPAHVGIIDSPTTPSSSSVLSRFEFENGKGNEGTKVLLVEWEAEGQEWTIDWDGRADYNMLAVGGEDTGQPGQDKTIRRVYFLMPPGALIPSQVQLRGTAVGSNNDEGTVLWTRPMPAIYPASLGPGEDGAGKRGVLHTLWAQRRLADLMAEIEAEMQTNSESIGLQIAFQEQDWISDHFGVGERSGLGPADSPSYLPYHLQHEGQHRGLSQSALPSPRNPSARSAKARSPIGGKLGEKLKGLKLATSPSELAAVSQASSSTLIVAHTSVGLPSGMNSLDAVVQGGGATSAPVGGASDGGDGEDELFALPLSPRSPEMTRSPFSFL